MIDIKILNDLSEVIHYDSPDIPYAFQDRKLSQYTDMKALCHWHKEIEFIYILDGNMFYDVNGIQIHLQVGDCLIVNSKQLHFGYSNNQNECKFICLLFHPELLNSNLSMYQKYVYPVISSSSPEYWHFTKDTTCSKNISNHFMKLYDYKNLHDNPIDYYITGFMHILWNELYINTNSELYINPAEADPDISIQKKMLTFIYQNYSDNIELKDIACAGCVSRSKCCLIFRKYMQLSPIAFLNDYRLQLSTTILKNTSYSITEIAISCGYNHISYFSKMFLKKYGCTPNQYRKNPDIYIQK